jgi:hypothetical protein
LDVAGKFQNGPGLDLPLLQFSLGRNNTPTKTKKSFSLSLFQVSSTSQLAYEATRKEKFETSHGGMEKLESFP